ENAVGDQFFQELRLGFEGASGFSGFVGASFFTEDGSQNVPLFYDETVAQALLGGFLFTSSVPTADGLIPPPLAALPSVLLNPATGAPVLLNPADPTSVVPLGTFSEEFTNFGENDAFDIFADVSYQLTDRLEFTAGVRYTRDDKTSGYAADSDGVSTLTGAGVFVGANVFNNNQRVEVSDTFDGFTYRFALAYALTDDINLFANYGRGRRPEVLAYAANVAQPNILAENFTTVDAETTDAFELGARGSTLDGRLNFDVTGYYYDYTNFQTTVLNDVGTPVPVNGGNASGFGFEFQNDFRVTQWAMLFANYAYNGVEFDDEDGDGNRQVRAGNRFRLSPEHAFTVGGVLSAETPVGSVRLTPLYSYKSKTFFDDDNDTTDAIQDEFQDGYGVVDLRFVMEPNFMEGLAIELFVENLANKEFIIDAGNTGDAFGIPTFIAGPPRLYGGYVRLAF
ncbi:MAG: TonB-dependent receptor, partial [Pseudomonadota bacterium]